MIAIIGMACEYPDAKSPVQLWENVLTQRRSFRRFPFERLSLDDYFSNDRTVADAMYITEGAFIEGYEFDRIKFRVAGSAYRSADLVHWLALDVASRAIEDAGLGDGRGLPAESTGVIVGNTLTGEFSRASLMRLRWPYVRRVLESRLHELGWDSERRRVFLGDLEGHYKAPFEPVGEETLAGGLSNTIGGRICNHFKLRGGGYSVDGACSSSLLAVSQACLALQTGEMDAVLAGGVDISLDPFELIGFAKAGALASGEMRVYDRDSSGFLPGEGCGFLVLMRHEDALERGLRCYALIRGWGVSSDGGGGITRPEIAGQSLALGRAYRRAGYAAETVTLFEGHGTGTPLGDEVELKALIGMLGNSRGSAYIGSVKANIGHAKAAAGAAGLIKSVMALHTQILPPATGVGKPHPLLAKGPLRILHDGIAWPEDLPLRAGVSSFGFGGINVHIALESPIAARRKNLTAREAGLVSTVQDAELFLFSGHDRQSLAARVGLVAGRAAALSYAELADVAATLAIEVKKDLFRAGVVASSPRELSERLAILEVWLGDGVSLRIDPSLGVFLGSDGEKPRIVFLFPGQATPVRLNGGAMERRFTEVKAFYQRTLLTQQENQIATEVAQPAIVAAELAGLHLLNCLGVRADLALGHSLGELTALHWAGAMDAEDLLRLVKLRGHTMANVTQGDGAMASIAADGNTVAALIEGEDKVVVAGFNSPRQTVISGAARSIAKMVAKAEANGLKAMTLPVSNGFHSPLMRKAAEHFGEALRQMQFAPLQRGVISTVTGAALQAEENIADLLQSQLTAPVRFTDALEAALTESALCLEVGPGEVIAGLVGIRSGFPVISLDCAGSSLAGLLKAVAAAFAVGADINHGYLFEGRFSRPFDLEQAPKFFTNPCEMAPLTKDRLTLVAPTSAISSEPAKETLPVKVPEKRDALALIRELVARRAELPLSAVQGNHHLLRDLHLNSISVGQIMVEATRQLKLPAPMAPTEFANATLTEAAIALEQLSGTVFVGNQAEIEGVPSGLDAWVLAFALEKMETKPPSAQGGKQPAPGNWHLFAEDGHPWAKTLLQSLNSIGGAGILVCLPPESEASHDSILLQAAHAALVEDGVNRKFVVVQHQGIAGSFVRTLYLESRKLSAIVVDVPFSMDSLDWILREAQCANGFNEINYDAQGRRWQAALRPVHRNVQAAVIPLTVADVLLVSGGGKGIAAECALALARETGVRLLLLGRSELTEHSDLAHNLERFRAAGVDFRYYQADVSDKAKVKAAVHAAQEELGPVTAILHGAGTNQPCALGKLDLPALQATLRPKILGLDNLLSAVDVEKLRLLVAFSSIIGRIGMHGEADYALANARLSRVVENFQASHANCRCLALEWSIWSGVGMGERLGRVEALLREGITPITPEQGMDWLRRLIAEPCPSTSMVVSGRLGAKPPLRFAGEGELPFSRFLEHPRVYYPGVELVADAEVSLASDPYLDDHVYQGERLFPAVFGLEAMAQAAGALANSTAPPVFMDVEFTHPVVVDKDTAITLRLVALKRTPERIEVALRSSQTAFQIDHFRAVCAYASQDDTLDVAESSVSPWPGEDSGGNKVSGESIYIPLSPEKDIYGKLLFHTGRFRRLLGYRALSAFHCTADIAADNLSSWFVRYLPQEFNLGDPGSRDAAIHALQACIPHATILPIGVDRIIPGDMHTPGPWTLTARERWQDQDVFCYDLAINGVDSTLRERWEGLRLRRVAALPKQSWVMPLLLAYLQRNLRERIPLAAVSVALVSGAADDRSIRSDQALHLVLGSDAIIGTRSDGKPEAEDGKTVSVAHSGELTLAVAGMAPLACDLERVVTRPEPVWHDLLGEERHSLATLIAQLDGGSIDVAATRVWAAIECLKKSGLPPNVPLTLQADDAEWVLFGAGKTIIATYRADVDDFPPARIFAVLA
ncbi:MAG: type I polyketide synthase [Proteobacteria bacterium]|nr:type I polyketide synthase [Pseudomonadota bacterium]